MYSFTFLVGYIKVPRNQFFSQTLTNTDSFSSYITPIIQLFNSRYAGDLHTGKLTTARHETENILSIHLFIKSKSWQEFKAGQYIHLHTTINGARLQRTFSIVSSPDMYARSGEIELGIRIQENGRVTPELESMLGETVLLSQAQGDFTLEALNTTSGKGLFIAGGIGITPILSMLRDLRSRQALSGHTLIYTAPTQTDMAYLPELLRMREEGLELNILETRDKGRIDTNMLQQQCPDFLTRQVFVCGPPGMIQSLRTMTRESGLPDSQLHYEYFGLAPSEGTTSENNEQFQVAFRSHDRRVLGQENGASLLALAESLNLNPVSGCRMGVCHQCTCQKRQGRVRNLITGEISDSGPEPIQLCISQAVSDLDIDL